jgi:hypothetical protein
VNKLFFRSQTEHAKTHLCMLCYDLFRQL